MREVELLPNRNCEAGYTHDKLAGVVMEEAHRYLILN